MTRRHQQIAEELRLAIADGTYPVGSELPSESELALAHGVSRGTLRQAFGTLQSEGLIGSRQGARRTVLSTTPSQSFAELRSFAQWARAGGRTPGGLVLGSRRAKATEAEAAQLHLTPGDAVLHVLRVRTLDGEPALLERTVYAGWVAAAVERLPDDCESVTQRRRGAPLLRVRRTTTTPDGRPVETSDDRYKPDSVVFTVRNSVQANPLVRTAPD
ncbi:GntR family transcriptional regulator [Streptomyces sp. BF-3]|nr:GntR family transcriptional regulator [Streptomyces sp. BF-3]